MQAVDKVCSPLASPYIHISVAKLLHEHSKTLQLAYGHVEALFKMLKAPSSTAKALHRIVATLRRTITASYCMLTTLFGIVIAVHLLYSPLFHQGLAIYLLVEVA